MWIWGGVIEPRLADPVTVVADAAEVKVVVDNAARTCPVPRVLIPHDRTLTAPCRGSVRAESHSLLIAVKVTSGSAGKAEPAQSTMAVV